MHFVYYVNLVPGHIGGEIHLFTQVTDLVDTAIAGSVDLHQIQGVAVGDGLAHGTAIARLPPAVVQAIYRLSQGAGSAGLTGTSRAAEKISMCHPTSG